MSLVKPFIATCLVLSGTAIACTSEGNPVLTLMLSGGRALERRRDAQFRVVRHQHYRTAVKTASGSRLAMSRLAMSRLAV